MCIRDSNELGPYQEGDLTHLTPAGLNGADPYRPVYFKNTNISEDNWSDLIALTQSLAKGHFSTLLAAPTWEGDYVASCLLYTSDAADERSSVDLGGRRII